MDDDSPLRVVTANICMVAPGGNTRIPVVLAAGGFVTNLAVAVHLLELLDRPLAVWLWLPPSVMVALFVAQWMQWGVHSLLNPLFGRWSWWAESTVLLVLIALGVTILPPPFAELLAMVVVWLLAAHTAQLYALVLLVCPAVSQQWKRQRCDLLLSYIDSNLWDVVVLQESTPLWYSNYYSHYLVREAAKLGLCHSFSSGEVPLRGLQLANAGLLVLSRFPLSRARFEVFATQSLIESLAISRGMVYAAVEHPTFSTVHLVAVHTTSGHDVLLEGLHLHTWPLYSGRNTTGLRQALECVALLRSELSEKQGMAIMCGDFNVQATGVDTAEYGIIEEALHPLGVRDVLQGRWEPTFGVDDETGVPTETLLTQAADLHTNKVLDYIFSSHRPSKAGVLRLAAPLSERYRFQQVSDHSAVYATWSPDLRPYEEQP